MRLLVSVANATDAAAAMAGGPDLIDAKNPFAGALGAVSIETLREIHAVVAGARPVTAALGDAVDDSDIARTAHAFAAAGASLLKIGFAGVTDADRALALAAAATRGAAAGGESRIICVAYADAGTTSLSPACLARVAARAGAHGVLLDTADKRGPGLRDLIGPDALAAWVEDARSRGLLVALAGKLCADDFPFVRDARAGIVGVRGAACDDGRTGSISAARVRALHALCTAQSLRLIRRERPGGLATIN